MRILDARNNPGLLSELTARRWEPNSEIESQVRTILDRVRNEGDAALLEYTRMFDCPVIDAVGLRVDEMEIGAAWRNANEGFLRSLRAARRNITRFHSRQKVKSWSLRKKGLRLEQRFSPLERVGVYVPGGKAAYPSTVLMNVIPAKLAGVREIVMVTPCGRDGSIQPEILAAARECGVTEIFRIGGAQAIAALAFGTRTIRPVDKITGPGNAYVAAAKRLVFGQVGIDMIAGPTEVVIVADHIANPEFIAADLLAQAEHDEAASAICVTTSESLVGRVRAALGRRLSSAIRKEIAGASLRDHGVFILAKSLGQAAEFVNALAPEHCEVMVKEPRKFAGRITKAGAIFVGPWSSEALGDYLAGPNHTLPTKGTARFSSALGVYDFMRFSNIIELGKTESLKMALHVEVLAAAEGLDGHAGSMRVRREHA
jgi:histidinol dehydrogenase